MIFGTVVGILYFKFGKSDEHLMWLIKKIFKVKEFSVFQRYFLYKV